jgi:hypothetical protein
LQPFGHHFARAGATLDAVAYSPNRHPLHTSTTVGWPSLCASVKSPTRASDLDFDASVAPTSPPPKRRTRNAKMCRANRPRRRRVNERHSNTACSSSCSLDLIRGPDYRRCHGIHRSRPVSACIQNCAVTSPLGRGIVKVPGSTRSGNRAVEMQRVLDRSCETGGG